jgi:hypothetical protein
MPYLQRKQKKISMPAAAFRAGENTMPEEKPFLAHVVLKNYKSIALLGVDLQRVDAPCGNQVH